MMAEEAFIAFHAATYRGLWAYAHRAGGQAALADDIVQDAYIRLLQADTAALAPPQLKAYLYRTATNLLRDHWRRTRRDVPDTDADFDRPDRSSADRLDLGIDLHEAFAHLPEQQRALLWLSYAEGYPHRDVARMLGLGEKSVRVLLFRARKKLLAVLHRTTTLPEVTR